MIKKVYRFSYNDAIYALWKLHPELQEETPMLAKDIKTEVLFEIEMPEKPEQRLRGTRSEPIYVHADTFSPSDRHEYTDDGYPM